MSYRVTVLRRAQKELAALPNDAYQRIKSVLQDLSDNPRPAGVRKLAGRDGWRLRVGHYRLLFEINDAERLVTILHVGHRKDVYRKP